MRRTTYRRGAPHRHPAIAISGTRGSGAHAALIWLLGVLASAFVLAMTVTAQSQPLGQTAGQTLTSPAADPAVDYVQQSALNNLFEINASRLALQRSQNPKVRAFAQQMVRDHTQAAARLRATIGAGGTAKVPVPTSLDARRQQDLAELASAAADAFDLAYLRGELQGSRNALDLHRAYAQSGADPALRGVASRRTAVVQRHLVTLETLTQDSQFARLCELQAPQIRAPQIRTPAPVTARLG